MSPHKFRRLALAHELLGADQPTEPTVPAEDQDRTPASDRDRTTLQSEPIRAV